MTSWLQNKKGFTLTELIVVITVIGILMGGVALSLTSHSSRARDTRRKTDLQQIKAALEFYRSDNVNGMYPHHSASGAVGTRYRRVVSGVVSYELVTTGHMSAMPIDPLSNPPTTITEYVYVPTTNGGAACTNATVATMCTRYTLTATEMEAEPDYSVTNLSAN